MSSQALKGLAILVAGILFSCFSTSSLASYGAIALGGLSEGSED